MSTKVRWEEMFRDEIEAAIAARPVCYFAYGLSEPHGVQNALGLDGLKARALVERAAAAHGGVVAPMTWWHVHETPYGLAWLAEQNAPVTYLTDVPAEVFLQQIVYQLRAAENAGFRAAVLVTGHYGGIEMDIQYAAQVYSSRRPLRTAAAADSDLIRYRDYRGDHAGVCETSQLWALRPELVDISRMPDEPMEGLTFASGEFARGASRREGEAIVASQIESLRRVSDALLEQADATQPAAPLSMDDAGEIWREILDHKDEWISSHPAEGFREYFHERQKLFSVPGL